MGQSHGVYQDVCKEALRKVRNFSTKNLSFIIISKELIQHPGKPPGKFCILRVDLSDEYVLVNCPGIYFLGNFPGSKSDSKFTLITTDRKIAASKIFTPSLIHHDKSSDHYTTLSY